MSEARASASIAARSGRIFEGNKETGQRERQGVVVVHILFCCLYDLRLVPLRQSPSLLPFRGEAPPAAMKSFGGDKIYGGEDPRRRQKSRAILHVRDERPPPPPLLVLANSKTVALIEGPRDLRFWSELMRSSSGRKILNA